MSVCLRAVGVHAGPVLRHGKPRPRPLFREGECEAPLFPDYFWVVARTAGRYAQQRSEAPGLT